MNCKLFVTLFAALFVLVCTTSTTTHPRVKEAALTSLNRAINDLHRNLLLTQQHPRKALIETFKTPVRLAFLGLSPDLEKNEELVRDLNEDEVEMEVRNVQTYTDKLIEAYTEIRQKVESDDYDLADIHAMLSDYLAIRCMYIKSSKLLEAVTSILKGLLDSFSKGEQSDALSATEIIEALEIFNLAPIYDEAMDYLSAKDFETASFVLKFCLDKLEAVQVESLDFEVIELLAKLAESVNIHAYSPSRPILV